MAAGTSVPSSPSPQPNGSRRPSSGKPTSSAKLVEYDRYIESQLSRTRRQVKGVDLMASLMLLAAGSMGYLLLAALADHWLVPGGMGFAGRVACLALFLAGVTAFVVVRLGPLLLRRINPVYAAQAIEQSRPGLKNSLVNFLMLRSSDALPQRVYEAIEEQAANGLSAAKVETAVDRSPLVKLLTLLMVLVSVVAIYRIVSPKNPFTSIRRVIAPWADISAPTRVAIAEIQPGETEGYHDQHLNVSAMISGLAGSEQPTLHYSTADGQVIDHHVRMTLPETGYRHAAELPADAAGLQQDLEYWITAGDAISPRYKVAVRIAPAIVVDSIDYAYPAYSEQTARSVPQRGDIRALEGTQVTIRATATHVIQSADVDFDCDGRRDLAMKIDGRKATATFTLALKKNSDEPEHESYQLRFRNQAGHENPKPIRYSIEVIRDLPPEIALIEPEVKPTEEIQLAEGASLPLKLSAADPDFKLADVRLHATRGMEPLLDKGLLAEPRVGPFERRYVFSTRSLKLKAGERVSLWASADDNKQPGPNHVETPRYTVRIVSPDGKQEQDQLANNDSNKKPDDKPQQDQPNGKPNPAERQPGDESQPNKKQQPGDEPQEKGGKDKDDKQKPRDKQPSDKDPSDKQDGQDAGDGAEGDKPSQGKQSGGKKPMGEDQKSDGQTPDDSESQAGEGEQGDGQQNGKNGKGSQKSAGGKGSDDNDERVDPEKDPGRAIEEINKFFNDKKNEDQKKDEPSTEKSKPSGDKQQGKKKEPGDQKQPSEGEPSDEKKSQGEPSDGEQSKEGGQDSDKQDGSKQKGKPQGKAASKDEPGSQEKGDKPAGADVKSGEKKDATQAGGEGEGKDSAMPEGNPEGGDEKEGKKQQGTKQPGKQQPGQEKASSKQSAGEEKTGEQKQGEGEKAGKESSDKSAMKDEAKSKNNPGNQESSDRPEGAEEKGAEKGAGEKKQGAGKEPAGEKKPEEDELRPGAGQDLGGEGQDKQPSDKNKPAEQGGNAGTSKSQDNTPQEPGDGDASGQDKAKQPGEQGAGDKAKMGEDTPKNAEGDQKSQAGKNGGQSKGQGEKKDKQNPDEEDPHKDAAGGDSEGQDKGKAGAGQKGGKNKDPAPSPMEGNKQRDKKLSPDEKGRANTDEESTSSSISKHQSDSKSNKSGEESGGGGKGGGQRSESPGKGSAGQNTDADQGGGQSEQTGEGPKSDKPGDQVKGEKPSGGKPSGEKGPGKSKQAGGSKAGGADGDSKEDGQSPDDAEKQPADSNQDQEPGGKPTPSDKGGHDLKQKQSSGNGPNNQTGGGVPPPDNPDGPAEPSDMSEPGGDDPNLEYTRKATDLALERLKDQLQKGDPDQELLDKLKWSRKDVEEFVKRWDQLKKSAQKPGAQGDAAREELDETLRSLGLHQRGSSLAGGQKRGDQRRNLIETRRTAPPPEYADQYREFSKGISRAKK